MRLLPTSEEMIAVGRSLVLAMGIFFVLWFGLEILIGLRHPEAAKFRLEGGSCMTHKLEAYDEARERVLYVSVFTALITTQTALLSVGRSREAAATQSERADGEGLGSASAPPSPSS